MLILYGATAGVSVVKLYAGAFIPGFLLAGMYMLFVMVRAWMNPALAPRLPRDAVAYPISRVFWELVTSFLPLSGLIAAVLGAILFGLATPSEAAAMGALGALAAAGYGATPRTAQGRFSHRPHHRWSAGCSSAPSSFRRCSATSADSG